VIIALKNPNRCFQSPVDAVGTIITERPPQSGRTVARSGLRMMPTFPPSPLSFRTAGFPQYGWKAGISDSAFPMCHRLKPAPGIRRRTLGLPLPFVHREVRLGSPARCRADDLLVHRLGVGFNSAPGALAPNRVILSQPIAAYQPHPTHSWAHRDFADFATYTRCLRCAGAPRRPRVVPSFHCLFLPGMPPSMSPGRSESSFSRKFRFQHGPSPGSERLGSSDFPAIRFKQGSISGLIGSPLLRPVRLLAPLDGSDRALPQPRGLLHPGFQRISHLSRCWISLRQSLEFSVGGTFTHWNSS
jgi:hypothetical protein